MSNFKNSILDYWPMKGFSPRKTQVEVLKWMEKQPAHIKYFLVEVPVGGGKSPLALTMSGWVSNSPGWATVLTPQKILQKQKLVNHLQLEAQYHLLHSHYHAQ